MFVDPHHKLENAKLRPITLLVLSMNVLFCFVWQFLVQLIVTNAWIFQVKCLAIYGSLKQKHHNSAGETWRPQGVHALTVLSRAKKKQGIETQKKKQQYYD